MSNTLGINPPKDAHLSLPPPALTSDRTSSEVPRIIEAAEELDPDLEAVQLRSIHHQSSPRIYPHSPHFSIRSRRSARISEISTAADDERSARSSCRLRRQTPRWYDGIVRFWKRHIHVTVDANARRDHLGES
jgi:hypothetical protein